MPFPRLRCFPDPVLLEPTARVVLTDALAALGRAIHGALPRLAAVGLAANQIGLSQRFFVHDLDVTEALVVNPIVVASGGDLVYAWEGCLSAPTQLAVVARPEWLVVAFDSVDGPREVRLVDWAARVFAHEIDHLDGRSMLDQAEAITPRVADLAEGAVAITDRWGDDVDLADNT